VDTEGRFNAFNPRSPVGCRGSSRDSQRNPPREQCGELSL
jgi:hypothetical protein